MKSCSSGESPALVAALLGCPALLFLAVWAAFLGVKGPYWLGSNLDPDYPYLLNGLSILSGFSPCHVDHPGTPVQVLVAGVLRLAHALGGKAPLVDDVLGRPEHYLVAANWALLLLLALALAWAGLATWRATHSLTAALVVQAVPALSSRVLPQVVCVKPEPLLLALAAALAALTMHALAARREPGVRLALAFGALAGLAACVKINAAPLALLPFLMLRRTATRVAFLAAAVGCFALGIAPALPQLGLFTSLVARIATHSGTYGAGAPSLLDPAEFAIGLGEVAAWNPALVAVIAGGAAIWLLARRRPALRTDDRVRALGAALAAQLATVLVVARHPRPYYALPAIGLSGLTLALALQLGPRVIERRRLALALVLPLAAFLSIREVAMSVHRYRDSARERSQELAAAAAARSVPGATLVYYYRASAPVFALRFGDEYTCGHWTGWLEAHYPGAVFYSPFSDGFSSYGGEGVRPPPGRPLVFQGSTLGREPFTAPLANHGLAPIFAGPSESVYLAPSIW